MWDLSCGGQLPWSIDEESAAAGGCVRIQSWQLYGTDVASLSKTDRQTVLHGCVCGGPLR